MSVPDVLPLSPPTTNHRGRRSLQMSSRPIMSTPDDSPASFPPSSGAGTRKRVEFSPWPNVMDPISSTPSTEITTLKPLPPSRDCQRNSKPILKPFVEPVVSVSSSDGASEKYPASPEMLEAIAQQLANNNKGSSLDAYQILSQVIKAYDETPEDVNTRSCIANILRCIKRDLCVQDQTQPSPIDTNLMTQALKVSVILVWSEHISPLLTDEFRVFIVDRAINTLAEHTAPKVVIIHYMHLLAMQNFRPTIMSSNNRAVKLLEALQEITNHVQGKGAVSERLLIYQKLIDQAKSIMKTRASLWMKEVFVSLSSSVKDLRDKAISVCTRACAAYPSSPTVSAAARDALASVITDRAGNSRTVSMILTQRLEKMVAAKDEAIQVPQMWALCILMCNSVESRLEGWSLLKDWLKVIQRCFNCSDATVRSQAFPAWNRFIYISKPHEASDNIVSMLAKPITAQIERTSSNTSGKGLRPAAVSSYHMLLYHAFRPAASHKQYTRMWNEYIVKIMGSHFLSKSTANADLCSRILISMMWKAHSAPRIWNENRAHENTLLEPEELPTIDCKWTRTKTEAILQIFGLLFKYSVWGPSVQHSDQAYVAKAWRHFLKAIRESASKEIKPSVETRKALLHIAQFLLDISESEKLKSMSPSMEGKAQLASSIAVAELGPLYFLDILESDTEMRSSVVISELLRAAAEGLTSDQNGKVPYPATNLSPHLQRCLKLMDETLQEAYDKFDEKPSSLKSYLNVTARAVKSLTPNVTLSGLLALQTSLSTVIEDRKNLAKLGSESPSLASTWMDLSNAVVNKITVIPVLKYQQIDDLLSAALLSYNLFTKNSLLSSWSKMKWQEHDACYGPKLLSAIYLVQEQVEIHLPGVQNIPAEPETQVQRDVQADSVMENAKISEEVNQEILVGTRHEHEQGVEQQIDQSDDEVTPRPVKSVSNKGKANRPRHNDSQVQFVSVDSSPKVYEEVESQFLTGRQKDVRERQRAEQAVTFPDLRLSPRPLSARGSRATSVDCEMARKVAAMDNLPSTPTISRQNEVMDEDELPSPTPKTRHKKLDLADVDIPSSPPSATANRKGNIGGQDIPSSPPKASNEEEAEMVNLDDAELVRDQVLVDLAQTGDPMDEDMAIEAASMHDTTVHPVVVDNTVNNVLVTAECEDHDATLGSTVMESIQDVVVQHQTSQEPCKEALLVAEDEPNAGADVMDELIASQLSQSLDMHLADEAMYTTSFNTPNATADKAQKRKKRATSGHADHDRKRRRRISSQNETSMSSVASDDFTDTNESQLTEDCIVVSTSPPVALNKKYARADNHNEDVESLSPITPTSTHRRSRSNKTSRLPVHVKPHSPETVKKVGENNQSPVAGTKTAAVTAQVMENSAYAGERSTHTTQEAESVTSNMVPNTFNITRDETSLLSQGEERALSTAELDVMNALQTALNGLNNINRNERASIDLKAIDDLCFKIRYQAQEIIHARRQR